MQSITSELSEFLKKTYTENPPKRTRKSAKAKPKKKEKKLAVIDFETDPFKYGATIKPFQAGFYSEEIGFRDFWGDDCIEKLLTFLDTLEDSHYIYAHNGGKFDYMFFVDRLDNPIKLINGRIAKAKYGVHELRDSYSIIPVALGAYKKDDIDYRRFEREVRHKHRVEITEYLKGDCIYLFELISAFVGRFGPKLTIGGTAIAELEKIKPIERTGEAFDTVFREFYFGGRVECFEPGIHQGEFTVIDVNSMYPFVMREYDHPSGEDYAIVESPVINEAGELLGHEGETYFAVIEAENDGSLPWRGKTSLEFNKIFTTFFATSHEIKTALKYQRIKIKKVVSAYSFFDCMSFVEYVDKYSAEKIAAKQSGDKVGELFAKFLLNSLYGKFGSNPENYFDYYIQQNDLPLDDKLRGVIIMGEKIPSEWEPFEWHENVTLYRKHSALKMFFNVATAASITGAARAVLLEALCTVERPYYCDTDSLIVTGDYSGLALDNSRLGAWKKEATGNHFALAGKKMYALMENSACVKLASKGAKLTHADIFKIARGETVEWKSDAPNLKMSGQQKYVKRNIRKT